MLPQQVLQRGAVEADYDFAVHHGDGRRHISELFELSQRDLISGDIAINKLNLALRKKLFHFSAKHSAGLAINDNFFAHRISPLFPAYVRTFLD